MNSRIQKFFFFQKYNFCISLLVLVISVVRLLFSCVFLSFFCLFCVSHELGWCLVMVLRMHWFCA